MAWTSQNVEVEPPLEAINGGAGREFAMEREEKCNGSAAESLHDEGSRDRLLDGNEEPPVGAHLVTPRIGYLHHGIYLGAGKVIHSGAVSGLLPRGPVEEVSLESFSRGRPVWVRLGLPTRFTVQEIVDRARSRLGEDDYHLLRNNCEHLCEWCLRGAKRSRQVERLMCWLRFWELHRAQKQRSSGPASPSLGCGAV